MLSRSRADGGWAKMAMAMVPSPQIIVAPSSAARRMNADAWKTGSWTSEASLTSADISTLTWKLVWKCGKAVNIRSCGSTQPTARTEAPALTWYPWLSMQPLGYPVVPEV